MSEEKDLDRQLLKELLFEVEIEGQKYPVGQPSPGRYKGEDYGWDPAFFIHSLVAAGETETALRMMDGIAKKIELAGYLPLIAHWDPIYHNFFWNKLTRDDPRFTAETQQPLIAQTALHLIREVGFDRLDRERVLRWTHAAQTHIDWLMINRRAEGRTLFFIIDPIESGEDTLPAWDPIAEEKGWSWLPRYLRIFWLPAKLILSYIRYGWDLIKIEDDPESVLIEPVSLNVFAAREMQALSVLWMMLANSQMAAQVELWARGQVAAIEEALWNEAAWSYFPTARFGKNDWRQMPIFSVESLYPLLLPELSTKRVMSLVYLIEWEFLPGANYMLPVAPVDSKHPQRVPIFRVIPIWWPGQVWANTNWFFREALSYQAERLTGTAIDRARALSARIDSDWQMLKGLSGYCEFYNQDGTGGAEKRFFWSCLRRARFRVEITGRGEKGE